MGVRQVMSSFNGGEVSRRLEGRVDLDGIYDRALAEMVNFVPTVEGPAAKRPGTRFIKAAALSSTWLSKFVFNVTQAYVLEWGDQAIRFYTNGGRIETAPDVPYEVVVPYSAAEAPRISAWQSFDRLRLAHGNHPPAALTRTGAVTFAYAELALEGGPFQDQNGDEAITVMVTGDLTVGGIATVTASSPIFEAGHIGAPFLVECKDFSDIPAWEVGIDGIVAGSSKRHSEGKVYLAATAGRTGSLQPTHSEGTQSDGSMSGLDINGNGPYGVKWTHLYDRYGVGRITAVGGAGLTATITVVRRFADSLATVGSHRWAHAAFSEAEGWPQHGIIYAGRQWFFKDLDVYASAAGGYDNFSRFTDAGLLAPDMGFYRRLDSADPPLWVKADRVGLIVGTASGEILVIATNRSAGISGDNITADPQSSYGSAAVWPIDIGTAVLFVQRGGRKVREAEYAFERDRFVGVNITAWARHIGRSGIKQLAHQQEPEEMLWAVRNDGMLAAHAHNPEQQVKGFARVPLADGAIDVLSAVDIPSEDGSKDELWILGELDGVKGVAVLADWWEEDDALTEDEQLEKLKRAFFVDWGVSYEGEAQAEFNEGLDHLIGKTVRILANGGVLPPQVVKATNPKITLPYAATHAAIGLGYQARMKPMRPEPRGRESVQGLRKKIVKLIARLIDTAALLVRDNRGDIDRLIDRPGSAKMDQPVPLFNGDTDNKTVGGGYDREGQPTIISDDPLPCIIPALIYELDSE